MDTQTISPGRTILRDEIEIPSRVQSLNFWRDVLAGRIKEYAWIGPLLKANGYEWGGKHSDYLRAQEHVYNTDYCGMCDGAGARTDEFGYYYCLCWLLQYANELRNNCYEWGSDWSRQSLDDMEIAGANPDDIKRLQAGIDRTERWIARPDKWLVYSGPTGTGKTHMLNAIMGAWYPYAMYVVASDFESRLRRYLDEGGGKIQIYMDALMFHPILVFDDIGMEYASDWITAKLDALIEFRSRKAHWWDTLTVAATNIRQKDIKARFVRDEGVSRIGSRMTDTEIAEWIVFTGMDFRNKRR